MLNVVASNISEVGEKMQSLRRGSFKVIFYIAVLAVALSLVNFLFGWASYEEIPPYLQPYSSIILFIYPYLVYIQAGLLFAFGYFAVKAISGLVYTYVRRVADHPTAATLRIITRISGVAVLLSLMTSVFNVNPAAALTVGSFGGLVVGFATQTILSHVVAGVFLLLSRPFTYGDKVTVSGQTGVVKQIRLMHLVLETEDGKNEILIPSGTVVTQIIQKKKTPVAHKPIKTVLILDSSSSSVAEGSTVMFTGKLVEEATRNPIADKTIKIFDSDVGGDDLLASGTTESDGNFSIKWRAKKKDQWDNTAEIYAKFEGDDVNRHSGSNQYTISVRKRKKDKRVVEKRRD